jgi:hypothetical protein
MRKPIFFILLFAAAAVALGASALSVRQTWVCNSLSTPQAEYDAFKAVYRSDRGRGAFALGPGRYSGNLTMDTDGIDLTELIPGTADFTGTITIAAGCDGRVLLYDRVFDYWPDVAAADPNYYHAGDTLEDGEPNLLLDYSIWPRNLVLRIDPNGTVDNFTITVTGLTNRLAGDTEVFSFSDWTDRVTLTGDKAWLRIGSITVADCNGLDGTERLYIGTGNKLGLSWPLAAAGDILRAFTNEDITNNITADATFDTLDLDPNAPDGTIDYRIWYQTTRRGR